MMCICCKRWTITDNLICDQCASTPMWFWIGIVATLTIVFGLLFRGQ